MSMSGIAERMQHIQPFRVMELLARARALETQGRSIIHMEVGEPDFPTAAPITRAGQQALEQGYTHYTPAVGLTELREAISAFYRRRYGVQVAPERIVVTPGASGALQLALGVLMNPGDEVLMADPGYPCNRNFVYLLGGTPVSIPVDSSSDYQLTTRHLQQHWTPATRAVMLASPSNPTGTLLQPEELKQIHALTREKQAALIVDEIYHGLVYEGDACTALALGEDVFVLNSFSKYFGMTGWRVGWLVAPPRYVEHVDKLAQNIFLAASTPAQHAALACFTEETEVILQQRREEFRRRRDYLLPALQEIGFEIRCIPQGAFYLYAGCTKFTDDSFTFCNRLLEEIGVAITPGLDFGAHGARQHVRFAYTTSLENLQEGVRRLEQFLSPP